MTPIKFCRSIRKIRTTSHAGMLVFKRLTDQLELLTPLKSQEFIKLHGHTLKALFFVLLIKSLMGTKSMDSFEDDLNDDRFIRKITNLTRKLGKTVLGRNMKRFKPRFLYQNYYALIDQLITKGLVTLNRIAIDSTFIEVFGKGYQKARFGWGKTKTVLGYRLSVAFDLDSKLLIAPYKQPSPNIGLAFIMDPPFFLILASFEVGFFFLLVIYQLFQLQRHN